MYTRLKAVDLEKRAALDILISIGAVGVVSISAYVFNLHDALSGWSGFLLFSEINPVIWVVLYSIWVLSIFILRRMEDLYALVRQRNDFERQSLEQRKTGFLTQMANGIIHDISNVMTTIRGFGEVAQIQIDENNPANETIHGILTAARRAENLLRHLTDFVRTEDFPIELLQVSGVVHGMEPILRYLCKPENIRIQFQIDDESGWTRISRSRIEEIILNVFTNAVEAMHAQGGILTVRVMRTDILEETREQGRAVAPGDYIRLSIRDSGGGIKPHDLEKIFDPYFTTKSKGCGFGLPVVRQIVQECNGFVRIESTLGAGTTVSVFVPCADQAQFSAKDLLIT